jgi:hypothetical protein
MPVKTDRRIEVQEEKCRDQDPAGLRERKGKTLGRKGSSKIITRKRKLVVARTKLTGGINAGPSEAPEMTDPISSSW